MLLNSERQRVLIVPHSEVSFSKMLIVSPGTLEYFVASRSLFFLMKADAISPKIG